MGTFNVDFDRCAYNDGVDCEHHNNCNNCGFKPAVQKMRVKIIKAEMRLGIYGEKKKKEEGGGGA